MGKLPAFQFYPGDWMSDVKLRRCSHAARGAWIDILCVLHDSEEYGIVRWPLDELAKVAGAPLKLCKELIEKGVLRGSDLGLTEPYIFTPKSGRKTGEPKTLIAVTTNPIWYSSRLVKDAHKRAHSGESTRFKKGGSDDTMPPQGSAPSHGHGERRGDDQGEYQSDGSSSSSSSSISLNPLTPTVGMVSSGGFLDQLKFPECLQSPMGQKAVFDYVAFLVDKKKYNQLVFQGHLDDMTHFSKPKAVGYFRAWHRRGRYVMDRNIDWEEYSPSSSELSAEEKPKPSRVRKPRVEVPQ